MKPNKKQMLADFVEGTIEKVSYSRGKVMGDKQMQSKLIRCNPRPFIILPGFLHSDHSMRYLTKSIEDKGGVVYGLRDCLKEKRAGISGKYNLGWSLQVRSLIIEKAKQLNKNFSKKPIIIGWSLGGVYALNIHKELPDLFEKVIVLSSPIQDFSSSTSIKWLYEIFGNKASELDKVIDETLIMSDAQKARVFSLIALKDGLVSPESCVFSGAENHMIECYHMSIMNIPDALRKIRHISALE